MKNILSPMHPICFYTRRFNSIWMVLFFIVFCASAQENTKNSLVTVKGTILDANTRLPIRDARIISLTYSAAALSDSTGIFSIKVPSFNQVLSVNAFDYNTREIVTGTDSVISVYLYPKVFTSQYRKIETITGPINNTLTPFSLGDVNTFSSSSALVPDNIIQTQLGGNIRSITRSGTPGVGTSLFIRGLNSLNANSQPLFIIDGAILEDYYDNYSLHSGYYVNPLLTIDPSDIESITVLKDGVSIYGSKASNGVVLIKTKRANDMVTKISVNGFWGVTSKPSSIPMMNSDEFRIFASDIVQGTDYSLDFLNNEPSWPRYPKYHNNTNWYDQVYQLGFTHNYSLNITGGDERALYMFSIGYTGDNGIGKNTDLEKLNARFNADIFLTKNITVGWNIGYTNLFRNILDEGSISLNSPSYTALIKAPFLNPYQYTTTGAPTTIFEDADEFSVANPLALIENSFNTNKQYRFNIGIEPKIRLGRNFTVKNHFEYAVYNNRENYYRPKSGGISIQMPNYISYNEVRNQHLKSITLFNDAQLIYSKNFNSLHNITGVLGWRFWNSTYILNYGEGHNTPDDRYRSLGDATYIKTNGFNNLYRTISSYATVDYSFKKRYLFSAALSMDASGKFGNQSKGNIDLFGVSWAMFPAANAAWIVSHEKFMKSLDFINFFKVRAGYSITGNDDIGLYNNIPYLLPEKFAGNMVGLLIGNLENNKIQWETTYRKSVGDDLNILNERVCLTGDYFLSTTRDLLTPQILPDVTGKELFWTNSGELSNQGFEASINVKALNLKALQWEIGLSAGHYKNRIESLPGGRFTLSVLNGEILSEVGRPAGVFYGYKTRGVFATQAQADDADLRIYDEFGVPSEFGAGDIWFDDLNGDHAINSLDRQIIGDPNPDIYGAITSKIAYRNLLLDVLITYSYGNDVFNYFRSQLEGQTYVYNQSKAILNRWRTEGQQTSIPKATYGDPMGNARFSDRWIEDGSYLKVKSVTLSYKVPLSNKIIEGLTVWASGNNLFTITNYLGRDPEFSMSNSVLLQGIDAGFLPNTRSYFMGIKLDL